MTPKLEMTIAKVEIDGDKIKLHLTPGDAGGEGVPPFTAQVPKSACTDKGNSYQIQEGTLTEFGKEQHLITGSWIPVTGRGRVVITPSSQPA